MARESRRTIVMTFRARPAERRILERAAEASGRSLSDLARVGAKLEALEELSRPAATDTEDERT